MHGRLSRVKLQKIASFIHYQHTLIIFQRFCILLMLCNQSAQLWFIGIIRLVKCVRIILLNALLEEVGLSVQTVSVWHVTQMLFFYATFLFIADLLVLLRCFPDKQCACIYPQLMDFVCVVECRSIQSARESQQRTQRIAATGALHSHIFSNPIVIFLQNNSHMLSLRKAIKTASGQQCRIELSNDCRVQILMSECITGA